MNRFILLALLSLAGVRCTTHGKVNTIPGIGFATDELKRNEYEVLGNAKGEGCAEEFCFMLFCNRTSDESYEAIEGRLSSADARVSRTGSDNFFAGLFATWDPTVVAEEVATYRAIESVPNADAMIAPRKTGTEETMNFLGIVKSKKSCAKMKGKAIRIKDDREMLAVAQAPAIQPQQLVVTPPPAQRHLENQPLTPPPMDLQPFPQTTSETQQRTGDLKKSPEP